MEEGPCKCGLTESYQELIIHDAPTQTSTSTEGCFRPFSSELLLFLEFSRASWMKPTITNKPKNVQWLQCGKNLYLVHTSLRAHRHCSPPRTHDLSFKLSHFLQQEGCTPPSVQWNEKEYKGLCTEGFESGTCHFRSLSIGRNIIMWLNLAAGLTGKYNLSLCPGRKGNGIDE